MVRSSCNHWSYHASRLARFSRHEALHREALRRENPLIVRAATTADGPGAVVTANPAAATAATTRARDRLMPGVPASLMTTTI